MSAPERVAPTIEGHIWLRIDFEEGGRYLGIPRRPVLAGPQHTYCPENRVRYIPTTPARGRDEPLDFVGRQVFAASERRVRQPSRWNCPVYGYWRSRSGNP